MKRDDDGTEYWKTKEIMPMLGYAKWNNFVGVIEKAQMACSKSGQSVENHFPDDGKMVEIGSNVKREVVDYELSRYACYLIAQSGDPEKEPIALAQTYFAIALRTGEIALETVPRR